MKKTLFLALAFLALQSNAQEIDTLYSNQIYLDVNSNLFIDTVINFDSILKNDLINSFENWAGVTFRDYEKVRVAKTENLISLVFIENKHYVKMDVKFKDGKMKILIFDDGNVYEPSTSYSVAILSRSFYLKEYFKIQGDGERIIYKNKKARFNTKYASVSILKEYKNKFDSLIQNISNSIQKESNKKESNW
jgi:hypothetical protein